MKHLLLTSVLALALTPAFSAENPVFKLFPGDVTFYLSFDEENSNADMAGGKGESARKIGTVSYADGVFGGKSLRSGQLQFDAAKNLDLTLPGTVILWVAPENWPAEKTEPKEKEPGFGAFYAHGGSYGRPAVGKRAHEHLCPVSETEKTCQLYCIWCGCRKKLEEQGMAYAGMHIQRREFYQFCQRAETRNVRASGADGGTDTFFPARHDGKRFGSIQSSGR